MNRHPKILQFSKNGDVIPRNMLTQTIKVAGKEMESLISKEDLQHTWNKTNILTNVHRMINSIYQQKGTTKIKILTNCNRDICRFLACPHWRDHCTLCEVSQKENKINSTTCDKYSTKFLVSQVNVHYDQHLPSHTLTKPRTLFNWIAGQNL